MECWICLSGEESQSLGSLDSSYCGCSAEVRPVHAKCLGRWQLQKGGTREETHCRFCNSKYQLDWRTSLSAPVSSSNSSSSSDSGIGGNEQQQQQPPAAQQAAPAAPRPPTPIMAIIFEGQVHRIKVYPGPEGKARFQQQIRDLVKLREDEEFEVEFECKAPDSGAVLHLDGMDAFDAATHCAALTAAERMTRHNNNNQHRAGSANNSNSSNNSAQQQQGQQQQQQDQQHDHGARRQGVTAEVQVASAQHSTLGSCPSSTPAHTAAAPMPAAANSF